ncbi:MAG: hypothetical protein R2752_12830 [Vicinamibacterales bacterium]
MTRTPARPFPVVLCALLLAGAAVGARQTRTTPPGPAGPQSQRPTFRGDVELIRFDVLVVDRAGRHVPGLTAADFAVTVDGAPRPVETVAEVTHPRTPPPFPADVPLDVAANTGRPDRLVMLVLDDLHFRARTDEVKSLIRDVVTRLGDGASLGLVTTSGTFGVEITEDRAQLLRAIDAFLDRHDPGRGLRRPVVSTAGYVSRTGDPTSLSGGPSDPASFFGAFHGYRTVEDVAKMVAADDGRRKAFVWVSTALPGTNLVRFALHPPGDQPNPCDRSTAAAWFCNSINGMFTRLENSNASVYVVSPGGPVDGGGSLAPISAAAGGESFDAARDPRAVDKLVSVLDNYYMVGVLRGDLDRGPHAMAVTTTRPGATVRSRGTYTLEPKVSAPRNGTPLNRLAAAVEPVRDLPLRLHVLPLFTAKGDTQVLATLEVAADALPPPDAAGHFGDVVEFSVHAIDLKKKRVERSEARRVTMEWPRRAGRPDGLPAYRLQAVLRVTPGPHQFRASAISRGLDQSGSVYLQLDVPSGKDADVAVSGLVLASPRPPDTTPAIVRHGELEDVSLPFAPALDRVFPSSGDLRVFFQVRAKKDEPARGTLAIIDAADHAVIEVPWETTGKGVHGVERTLNLEGIPEGPCRIIATTVVNGVRVERTVGIRVGG